MNEELEGRFQHWYDTDEHSKIVDTIMAIPEEERDYDMLSWLSRSLNNCGQYRSALKVMESIRERGEEDPKWHYRRAYSFVYLEQWEDTIEACRRAIALGRGDDPDIWYFLARAAKKTGNATLFHEAAERLRILDHRTWHRCFGLQGNKEKQKFDSLI